MRPVRRMALCGLSDRLGLYVKDVNALLVIEDIMDLSEDFY
jgi:hypothetical protein